jgi:DNA-binding MarR family transcriptional regulator
MVMSSTKVTKPEHFRLLKTYHVGVIESAAHRALRKHKDALLKDYGLTGMQWYIIGMVADAGYAGIRITDLAKQLDTTQAFLTNTVNLLESKGIVERRTNTEDNRSSFVVLKESYHKTCDEIERNLRTKLRKSIYSRITPEQLKTYIEVITKFSDLT